MFIYEYSGILSRTEFAFPRCREGRVPKHHFFPWPTVILYKIYVGFQNKKVKINPW